MIKEILDKLAGHVSTSTPGMLFPYGDFYLEEINIFKLIRYIQMRPYAATGGRHRTAFVHGKGLRSCINERYFMSLHFYAP